MKVVLISCGSKKSTETVQAKDMYQSALFKKSYDYAKRLNPDKIFILSAKYGLLNLDKRISPYDLTLNNMNLSERQKWAEMVINQIKKEGLDLKNDEFIILAGEKYYNNIIGDGKIVNCQLPLKGLTIGKRLQFLQ